MAARKAFWAAPLDTNQLPDDVLPHKRPDGFNLDNSPYLDRLLHLVRDEQAGARAWRTCGSRSRSCRRRSAGRRRESR